MKTKELTTQEEKTIEKIIYEKSGCFISRKCLLNQAFKRSSYSAENGGENNEILEFIGDQVLSYYAVKYTAERFGGMNCDLEYTFKVRENRFSALRQELVNNETLAKIIDEWDVAKYLIVGKSDLVNEVAKQTKTKADLLEAIIGAIAIQYKWDGDVLEKAVAKILSLDERLKAVVETEYRPAEFDIESSVSTLKEAAEHGECSPPNYSYGEPESIGYDEDGSPRWCCTCTVETKCTAIIRQVWSSSKKAVKKAAAYLVLCDLYDLQNEYGPNGKYGCWVYKDEKLVPWSKTTHRR